MLWVLLEAIAGRGERCVVVSTSTATLDLVERMVCRQQGWVTVLGGERDSGLWRVGGRHGTRVQYSVVGKVLQVPEMGGTAPMDGGRPGRAGEEAYYDALGYVLGQLVSAVEQPRIVRSVVVQV